MVAAGALQSDRSECPPACTIRRVQSGAPSLPPIECYEAKGSSMTVDWRYIQMSQCHACMRSCAVRYVQGSIASDQFCKTRMQYRVHAADSALHAHLTALGPRRSALRSGGRPTPYWHQLSRVSAVPYHATVAGRLVVLGDIRSEVVSHGTIENLPVFLQHRLIPIGV